MPRLRCDPCTDLTQRRHRRGVAAWVVGRGEAKRFRGCGGREQRVQALTRVRPPQAMPQKVP